MFKADDKVVNSNGITCVIDRIECMKVPYTMIKKDYYVMHDLIHTDNVYYIPTDTDRVMRYPLTDREARELIDKIEEIEVITVGTERFRDDEYRKYIKTCSPTVLIGMLKFFKQRKDKRLAAGKNLSSIDEKYMKIALRNLCSELSFSLSLPPNEVETLVYKKIG